MKSWTNDIDGLCVALRLTKSRREAIKLVATWRAPLRPAPAPEPTFEDEPQEDPPPLDLEMQVECGKALLDALRQPLSHDELVAISRRRR